MSDLVMRAGCECVTTVSVCATVYVVRASGKARSGLPPAGGAGGGCLVGVVTLERTIILIELSSVRMIYEYPPSSGPAVDPLQGGHRRE